MLENHINDILGKLSKREKQVVALIVFCGLSRFETANLLNVSPNTIKSHMSRICLKLASHDYDPLAGKGDITAILLEPLLAIPTIKNTLNDIGYNNE